MKGVTTVRGMREIHIPLGMFDFAVNVVTGPRENLLRYVLWKLEVKPGTQDERRLTEFVSEEKRGCHVSWAGFCPIVWIPRIPQTPREHGTLAHEAYHAVCRLMYWADMPMTQDTEEVMAHAISHLVTRVLEARNK